MLDKLEGLAYPLLIGLIVFGVMFGAVLLVDIKPPARVEVKDEAPWYGLHACAIIDGQHVQVVGILRDTYVLARARRAWHEKVVSVPYDAKLFDQSAIPTTCPRRSEPSWAHKRRG